MGQDTEKAWQEARKAKWKKDLTDAQTPVISSEPPLVPQEKLASAVDLSSASNTPMSIPTTKVSTWPQKVLDTHKKTKGIIQATLASTHFHHSTASSVCVASRQAEKPVEKIPPKEQNKVTYDNTHAEKGCPTHKAAEASWTLFVTIKETYLENQASDSEKGSMYPGGCLSSEDRDSSIDDCLFMDNCLFMDDVLSMDDVTAKPRKAVKKAAVRPITGWKGKAKHTELIGSISVDDSSSMDDDIAVKPRRVVKKAAIRPITGQKGKAKCTKPVDSSEDDNDKPLSISRDRWTESFILKHLNLKLKSITGRAKH
jgi:hypothetical protein